MKTKIIGMAIIGLLCFAFTAGAQVTGIKGGMNISDVSGISGTNRISGYVGLYYTSPIRRGWAIQPEIWYSGEGEHYQGTFGEQTLALSYVKVPVMFQFYPSREFAIEFGPQLGILTSATIKEKGGSGRLNVISSYNRMSMGLGFGLGVKASEQVGLNARYNVGITDITANNNSVSYSNQLQLGLAVRIR